MISLQFDSIFFVFNLFVTIKLIKVNTESHLCVWLRVVWTLAMLFLSKGRRGHDGMVVWFTREYLSPLKLWVRTRSWGGVLDAALCDKVCQWLAIDLWFSPGTPVSSTNKTNRFDKPEIVLKVALNTINQT